MLARLLALVLSAAAVVAMVAIVGCGSLGGGDYPTKQVTYLIPFDPGRTIGPRSKAAATLSREKLGTEGNYHYKAGGGGAIGWGELVRAKPDAT